MVRHVSVLVILGLAAVMPMSVTMAADVAPVRAAPEPASHSAVYAVTLASARSGSGIVSASGEMIYKFADACDGWTIETHNLLNLVDDHGDPASSGWDFLSWESKDGLSYRFRVRSTQDDEEIESIEGTARLDGKGLGGRAVLTRPSAQTILLPPGTQFPTEHTVSLVETAMAGEKSLFRLVFDGSLVAPPFEVNALFGPLLPTGTPGEMKHPLLESGASWRMHLAYFRADTTEALPYHEIAVRYHDNGVGQELVQDYGTFRLNSRLKKLEPLPKPSC